MMRYDHKSIKKSQEIRAEDSFRIAITGGGTGSHIYPGIAVANELKRQLPSASVLFVGAETGLEAKIVSYEDFTFKGINLKENGNNRLFHSLKRLYKLPPAFRQARQLLAEFRPAVVLGTGGSVSVPVIYAAYTLKIPTLILELNKEPEFESKLLCKSVEKIAVCFEAAAAFFPIEKIVLTRHPVRKAFSVIGKTQPPDKGAKHNILILAGMREAQSVNRAVIKALDYLKAQRKRLAFTHQTGTDNFTYIKAGYKKKGFRAEVFEYIHDLPRMYAKSHLIICRAGVSTIEELRASQRPAILIPSSLNNRQQKYYARMLIKERKAKIILEKQLSGKILAEKISDCFQHPEASEKNWPNQIIFNEKTAAAHLVEICFELANFNID